MTIPAPTQAALPPTSTLAALAAAFDVFLLRDRRIAAAQRGGEGARTCFLLARGSDTSPVDGLGLTRVARAEDADLVLAAFR